MKKIAEQSMKKKAKQKTVEIFVNNKKFINYVGNSEVKVFLKKFEISFVFLTRDGNFINFFILAKSLKIV